ncbi:MAG TPA: hypothetical protein GX510_04580 [Firmicutes bacterium]|nr:hypothetical protein [Candidatus Fermentithermobacillaceae bacterium]
MVVVKKLVLSILAIALFISTTVATVSNVTVRSILDPAFYLELARKGGVYDLIRSAIAESFRTQVADVDDPVLQAKLIEAVSGALRQGWMDRELEKLLKQAKDYLDTGKSARFTLSLDEFKAALQEELKKKLPNLAPYFDPSEIPSSIDITGYLTGADGILAQLTGPYLILERVPAFSLLAAGSISLLMLLICLLRPDGFRWVSMPLILSSVFVLAGALAAAFGTGLAKPVLVNLLPVEITGETEVTQAVLGAVSVLGRRTALYSGILLVVAIAVWVAGGFTRRAPHPRDT